MDVSTYGYRIPETGDASKGSSGWFTSIEFSLQRLDTHNHDGSNSALLSLSALAPYTGTISAGSWASDGGGYKQTVTVPAGVIEVNNYHLSFIFTAPAGMVGYRATLGYKRLSATTYEVYCNDNTAAFTVIYR